MSSKLLKAETDIGAVCEELNKYLLMNYKYKNPPATFNINTIHAVRVKFSIYLRFNNSRWRKDTLVIANLIFEEKQKGHGTNLLNFFINIASHHKIKQIGLESTNDNLKQFAKKLGFYKIDSNNYIISIKKLELNLKNKTNLKLKDQ